MQQRPQLDNLILRVAPVKLIAEFPRSIVDTKFEYVNLKNLSRIWLRVNALQTKQF